MQKCLLIMAMVVFSAAWAMAETPKLSSAPLTNRERANEMRYEHPRGCWLNPQTGEIMNQTELLHNLAQKQMVLLGEQHDVAEIHRWQLHMLVYLHAFRPNMAVGFEMFPVTVQPVLDKWVAGEYTTAEFLEAVEWDRVWGFDPAIYLPLFHFCRQQQVPMLALNYPRQVISRIGKEGYEAVPQSERLGLTPAAQALPGHADYLAKMMGPHFAAQPERFLRAQQAWDRAFACNMAKAIELYGDDVLVVGIMGRGHMEYGFGTPHQLRDLGVTQIAVLLPTEDETHAAAEVRGIGDALFRHDVVEPRAER